MPQVFEQSIYVELHSSTYEDPTQQLKTISLHGRKKCKGENAIPFLKIPTKLMDYCVI